MMEGHGGVGTMSIEQVGIKEAMWTVEGLAAQAAAGAGGAG